MEQKIQFIYTKAEQAFHVWGLPESFKPVLIDIARYKEILFWAVYEVLQPLRATENVLRNRRFTEASYLLPPSLLHNRIEAPWFAGLKRVRVNAI